MREKIAKDLRPQGRLPSLSSVISSIQELLDSNKTVLSSCEQAFSTNKNVMKSCKALLRKPVFDKVESYQVDGKLLFASTPDYSEMEFDIEPLVKLPSELAILRTTRIKSGLIDYESLFKMSSALDDSSGIRISFLINLKNQLLLVQSCLNSIEKWWNDSPTNLCFVNSIFGNDTVAQAEAMKIVDPLCKNCSCFYRSHISRIFSGSTSYSCPIRPDYRHMTVFKRSATLPLRVFDTSIKIEDSFNLFDENERAKLVKLVTFLSHK